MESRCQPQWHWGIKEIKAIDPNPCHPDDRYGHRNSYWSDEIWSFRLYPETFLFTNERAGGKSHLIRKLMRKRSLSPLWPIQGREERIVGSSLRCRKSTNGRPGCTERCHRASSRWKRDGQRFGRKGDYHHSLRSKQLSSLSIVRHTGYPSWKWTLRSWEGLLTGPPPSYRETGTKSGRNDFSGRDWDMSLLPGKLLGSQRRVWRVEAWND